MRARVLSRPEITLGAFLLACLVYKIMLMWDAAVGPLVLPVLKQDAAIFGATLGCYVLSVLFGRQSGVSGFDKCARVAALLMLLLGLLMVSIYAVDVFVYKFFATRLYIGDLLTFAKEPEAVLTLLTTGAKIVSRISVWKVFVLLLGAALVLRASWLLLSRPGSLPNGSWLVLCAVAVCLLFVSSVALPRHAYSYGDKPLYESFVKRNLDYLDTAEFSAPFRERLLATEFPTTCRPGEGRRVNVILVIVESLSAYHSHFFSGIENWTPRLDEIARRETALTNFHANGWTTIGGLIALVGGAFPIPPERNAFNLWGSPRFWDFQDVSHSMARFLGDLGYETVFISAGDLAFLGQRDWLQRVGFRRIIAPDDRRLAKETVRGPFNSVTDAALYAVVMEEVIRMRGSRPFLLVAQTFWSHRPFLAPDGSAADSEETVIRYADEQLGSLYQTLSDIGFLEDGVLIVTGDHRAMEPFRKSEVVRFGDSAPSRLPAIVATRATRLPTVIAQHFQQRDVVSSIQALVGNDYCLRPLEGTFLGAAPAPPACVIQARGDDRDLVYVKCGEQEGLVKINGDETDFVTGKVDQAATVIHTVNRTRARKLP